MENRIKMPSEAQIKRYIERVLSNNLGVSKITKKQAPKLLEQQIKKLREYISFYENKPSSRGGNIKPASISNTLVHLRGLGLFIKKPYEDAEQKDLIEYIKSMNGKSQKHIATAKVSIRSFYKWMHNMHKPHEFPKVVDHPILVPQNVKVKRRPQDLLTKDEIKRMLEVAGNNRNRSLVMLSVGEGGCRASEITSANIDSIEFDSRGAKFYTEKSKSKERFVRLIDGEPYLREYINKEYELDQTNKNNPLFYARASKSHHERLGPNAVSDQLRRLARKTGIKKRVYTHLGRHINITRLKKMGMSSELIARRHGITVPTMQNVYLTLDDKDADDAYTKAKNKLTDEEKKKLAEEEKKLAPKICPRCRERFPGKPDLWQHPATATVCTCGMMLDGTKEKDLKTEFFSEMFSQYMKVLQKEPDMSLMNFMRMLKEKIK